MDSDRVRLKPASSVTETSWGLEILDLASIGTCIILSRQQTTKVLIRLICVSVVRIMA